MFDFTKKGKWWDIGAKVIHGCTRISEGCKNCWSLGMEHRFNQSTEISCHFNRLHERMKKKVPVAFAIWNDLFHEDVPFEFIDKLFSKMIMHDQHVYMILTKRPQRIIDFLIWYWKDDKLTLENMPEMPSNIWIGVTAENQQRAAERIPLLLQVPAKIRFVSCEPLLSEINLINIDAEMAGHKNMYFVNALTGKHDDMGRPCESVNKLDWVIAGAETGSGKRPMKKEWIESLYNQSKAANVPFFDKQNVLGLDIHEIPDYASAGNSTKV